MTFIVEVPNELGQQIIQEATQRGTDPQAFFIEAARRALDPDVALDALLESLAGEPTPGELAGLGPLSDEAMSRASFYEIDEDSGS